MAERLNTSSGEPEVAAGYTAVERVYERHLDLLLAEELACNAEFFTWFTRMCRDVDLPDGEANVSVMVGHVDRTVAESHAAGEDDLFLEATFPAGERLVLLIENKIDAVLQPRQIERYLARAARHRSTGAQAAVVAVAPASYLSSRKSDLSGITTVSVEDIARALEDQADNADAALGRRLKWRSNRLTRLESTRRSAPADYPPTIALRDYLVERLTEADPLIEPRLSSMRTSHTTWLYMNQPEALLFKVSHDLVDIYVRDLEHPECSVGQLPEGFIPSEDSSGNHVIRFGSGVRRTIDEIWTDQGPTEPDRLRELVAACARAAEWIRDCRPNP